MFLSSKKWQNLIPVWLLGWFLRFSQDEGYLSGNFPGEFAVKAELFIR
jgi:hypothetical protein